MSGRIRTVKPEWLEDELMAQASDAAARLSVGLILLADDYGRGRASLAFLASSVWGQAMERNDGADAPEVLRKASGALRELVEMRFVTLYEVDRQRYFAVRNWDKHQKVSHKGLPRVPEPPTPTIPNDNGGGGAPPESLRNASGNPPETLVPDPDLRSGSPTTTTTTTGIAWRDLPPLGRVLSGFRERWEAHVDAAGAKLGDMWPGARQHDARANEIATEFASDPDALAASLDGYFASTDPFAAQTRWTFKVWANDPRRWISARVEPAIDISRLSMPKLELTDDDTMTPPPKRARA